MLIVRIFIIISFLVLLFNGCFKENENPKVLFNCIRLSDTTLYLKVSNKSESDIYIPSQYYGDFNFGYDSIYLEGFSNPKPDTTWFYKYNAVLPFPIYLNRQISELKPDSSFFVIDVVYYNQFRVQPFVKVKKDSIYLVKVNFNIPCNAQVAKAVYYKKDFFKDGASKNGDYLVEDFVIFERKYAKKETCPIYQAFVR